MGGDLSGITSAATRGVAEAALGRAAIWLERAPGAG